MKIIQQLLQRDLKRRIEEVVQVEQDDPNSVHEEITEYVATRSIRDQYHDLLRAMAEAPSDPTEGVGVWISGFFGSGKSSFAKNLGHALSNPQVLGHDASRLFTEQLQDERITNLVELLNARYPVEAVMFDVNKGSDIRRNDDETIAEIVLRALLRALDYAPNYDIAALEIQLEAEGRLDAFIEVCRELSKGQTWKLVRKGATKFAVASAAMHQLDPQLFSQPDSWELSLKRHDDVLTVQDVVERAFTLMEQRRPGKSLVLIMDEVGQYVARSASKIENLRALVEEFGRQSKNRIRAKKLLAPAWVVITSQEKLDEVVSALEGKRVEIAKMRDRFRHQIDLAPADIREVASRRVLQKTSEGEAELGKLFDENQGVLNTALRLERAQYRTEMSRDEFVQFYPYPPYFVELCIDIMSGVRSQPGAMRQLGGSNRTIISQIYQMLVNERTAFATREVGALVTLDRVYELIENHVGSERRRDISAINERFRDEPAKRDWALRVAKVVCLLEFVAGMPRTPANIAACLVDEVGAPAPVPAVQNALQVLAEAHFIRQTSEGWKLQTAQEKNWEEERQGFLEPKTRDRTEIVREVLRIISSEMLAVHRGASGRTFKVAAWLEGTATPVLTPGTLPLILCPSDSNKAADFAARCDEIQNRSRQSDAQNQAFWVFALDTRIDDAVAQVYASRQMIARYQSNADRNIISQGEGLSLQDERNRREGETRRLREALEKALEGGSGFFRGEKREASSLGNSTGEIFQTYFDWLVPLLYRSLEMGARPVRGNEAEVLLKAANLNGLPEVLLDGSNGLGLVRKDGSRWIIDLQAPIAREVYEYLKYEHDYGNKSTGKSLQEHFGGFGFGWEPDVLRAVVAALLRAGAVEVTHDGRAHRNFQDAPARAPFLTNNAFGKAAFAPRVAIDRKVLARAASRYEDLTGEEVDVEESAIAEAFARVAASELALLLPLAATVDAHRLPLDETVAAYRDTLRGVADAPSDDRVRLLAGEGNDLLARRDRVRAIRAAFDKGAVEAFAQARHALQVLAPALATHLEEAQREALEQEQSALQVLAESEGFIDELGRLQALTQAIQDKFHALYSQTHQQRYEAFLAGMDAVRGQAEWLNLPTEAQTALLMPLQSRLCLEDIAWQGDRCAQCGATLREMESDVAALPALRDAALARLRELSAPPTSETSPADAGAIVRVSLAQYFAHPLRSIAEVDEAIGALRDALRALSEAGSAFIVEP